MFATRTEVECGSYSQIEAEFNLFREANKRYCHPYSDKFAISSERLIERNHGTPYVFKKQVIDELKNSLYLFARKFESENDK